MHDNGIFNGRDLYEKTEFELIRLFGKEVGVYITRHAVLTIVK